MDQSFSTLEMRELLKLLPKTGLMRYLPDADNIFLPSGFMWDIAPEFNALLVFAEHRFFTQLLVSFLFFLPFDDPDDEL